MTISEQLRKLLAGATPGDWGIGPSHVIRHKWRDANNRRITEWVAECVGQHPPSETEANAALIVFLRNNAPHFATLEEENVRLREAGKRLLSWWPENSGNSHAGKAKGDGYAAALKAWETTK